MEHSKEAFYYYSNLSGKAKRLEFGIYFFFEIVINVIALYLSSQISIDNENILKLFYTLIILLISFIPIQAAATRRLNDLKLNKGWIFINFIPIINLFFKLALLLAKRKEANFIPDNKSAI